MVKDGDSIWLATGGGCYFVQPIKFKQKIYKLKLFIFSFSFLLILSSPISSLILLYFSVFLVFRLFSFIIVGINCLNVHRRLIIMMLCFFFDNNDWDQYIINRRGTFWDILGSLWLIEMDPPWFPFTPRESGRSGYGGFVYLKFAIGGCPKAVFYLQKVIMINRFFICFKCNIHCVECNELQCNIIIYISITYYNFSFFYVIISYFCWFFLGKKCKISHRASGGHEI
jgi:hypothetical protein